MICIEWRDIEGVQLGFGAWKSDGRYNFNEYIMYV